MLLTYKTANNVLFINCWIFSIVFELISPVTMTTKPSVSHPQGLEHSEVQHFFDVILQEMIALALSAPKICTQVSLTPMRTCLGNIGSIVFLHHFALRSTCWTGTDVDLVGQREKDESAWQVNRLSGLLSEGAGW